MTGSVFTHPDQYLQLERWFFVARQSGTNTIPYLATLEGRNWVMAFSSPEQAYEFATLNGLVLPGRDVDLFDMHLPKAVTYCLHFKDLGIEGIWFDWPGSLLMTFEEVKSNHFPEDPTFFTGIS